MKERVLSVFFLVLAGLWIINIDRKADATTEQTDYNRFWIAKTYNSGTYNFLVCGDSRVYRGISSDEIERNLPFKYRVFNYGYSSGSYSAFMLDKIESRLDFDSTDPVLLLGITPYSLTPKAGEDGHIKEELARKREEVIEYLYLIPIKQLFEPFNTERFFCKSQASGGNKESTHYHQEFYHRQGWVASWKTPIDSTKALQEYIRDFTGNTLDSAMVKGLIDRIQKWIKKGIHVYGFRPPTTRAMVLLENRMSGFNEVNFVKAFEKAGAKWIDIPMKGFTSYDGSHLDKQSALKLSAILGEKVNADLRY